MPAQPPPVPPYACAQHVNEAIRQLAAQGPLSADEQRLMAELTAQWTEAVGREAGRVTAA